MEDKEQAGVYNMLVVYHSADPDGWFSHHVCAEALQRPNTTVTAIGWDYKDGAMPPELDCPGREWPWHTVYIVDLSIPDFFARLINDTAYTLVRTRVVWLDHHESAIRRYGTALADLRGIRHTAIAACRLAHAYFYLQVRSGEDPRLAHAADHQMPDEPLELFLIGLYDAWRHESTFWETAALAINAYFRENSKDFFARRAWTMYRRHYMVSSVCYHEMITAGTLLLRSSERFMRQGAHNAYILDFEGVRFIACNSIVASSRVVAQRDLSGAWRIPPPPGVQAILLWSIITASNQRGVLTLTPTLLVRVGLYNWPTVTPPDLDLSLIAAKWGGGGHRGACGFAVEAAKLLPLLVPSQT